MTKVALLVGVSEYEADLSPLPAAVNDVAALQRILQDPEMGGFDEVKVLTNPDPQVMQYEIETLFTGRSKNDLVLLFFSGHGIKDDSNNLYFATRITRKNSKGDLIRATAVPARFIHEVMNNSRAKRQAIILDCCFSGAFDPGLQAKDDSSVDLQGQLGAEGRVVLASSSSTQYSFEQQGSDLSLYTRYLVEGIETGAGDRDEDGRISIRELHDYATDKVQETAPKMTPKLITLRDLGFEIVLAKAKVTDPKLRYRKQVERYSSRGNISSIGRTILEKLQTQLGLTSDVAREIEAEVLRPYHERLDNLQRYQQVFSEAVEYEYPLSSYAQSELEDLREVLGLRQEDVESIEQEVLNQLNQNLETEQNDQLNLHQDNDSFHQNDEESTIQTSALNEQPDQVSLEQRNQPIPTPVVSSTLRPNNNSAHETGRQWLTNRRQFIKVAGFAGTGLGIAGLFQLIKLSSSNNSPSSNPTNSSRSSPVPTSVKGTIQVGILHSLSGTMAISEKSLVDAEMLAIEQINNAGGVLGQSIEAIIEDGASDWPTFAEKARKLIDQDKVVAVFGCWTSASRKSVLPTFEDRNHMLWYPVQYEGQECSRNIFYTGATPNQQIEPSIDWLLKQYKGQPFFLIGSDYVFPRTANTIIKAQLAAMGGKVVGEDYIPLGSTEVAPIISKIRAAMPNGGIIYNSLNGDSNVAFFKQLQGVGMGPDKYPSMSVSIGEEEVQAIGVKFLKGHYAAWNYFQTVDTAANKKFVEAFKAKYGSARVLNDPMEAAYIMVYIWKQAVEKAATASDLDKVRLAAYGQTFDAPEGMVTMNTNHHLSKFVRIGQVRDDGLFNIIYETKSAVKPEPWNQFIAETKGYSCDWSDPKKGGKYKA